VSLPKETVFDVFESHTRLRIGKLFPAIYFPIILPARLPGEDIIEDESWPLCDYNIKHNSTIYLDIGKVVCAGAATIQIKACVLLPPPPAPHKKNGAIGLNSDASEEASRAARFSNRGPVVEVEMNVTATARELRDKLGYGALCYLILLHYLLSPGVYCWA
jgi:hypothetical protein